MSFPYIHLNGTAAETLLQENMNAIEALREAIAALQNAAPHPRDYYPMGSGAYGNARVHHEAQCRMLNTVMEELMRTQAHIAGIIMQRDQRKVDMP